MGEDGAGLPGAESGEPPPGRDGGPLWDEDGEGENGFLPGTRGRVPPTAGDDPGPDGDGAPAATDAAPAGEDAG